MDWNFLREAVQTVGSVSALILGIVTGAYQVARSRREHRHARTELRFWRNTLGLDGEDPDDGRLVARLWVGSRRFYLVHAWLYVGNYGTEGRHYSQQDPAWLEAGQSLEITQSFRMLVHSAESGYENFEGKVMPRADAGDVRVTFECGEGDKHSAKLNRTDKRALRQLLEEIDAAGKSRKQLKNS